MLYPISPSDQHFFSIVVIPDSQHAVEEPGQEERIHCLQSQVNWILENKEKRNICFVSHVGDYVHHRENEKERRAFFDAVAPLFGQVPFGFCAGNHDILLSEQEAALLPAREKNVDAASFYQPKVQAIQEEALLKLRKETYWLCDRNGGQSSAQIFEACGQKYLALHLEYGPTDETVAWLQAIAQKNAHLPALLTTHMFLTPEESQGITRRESRLSTLQGNMVGAGNNAGEDILEKLIRPCKNIRWVFSGHYADERYLPLDLDGRTVHAMLSNYEWDKPYNGNSWLRLLTFFPDDRKIQVDTYSPLFDAFRIRKKSSFFLPF
ncbi:MAG: hypothetical protein E7329_12310 [Clostridiales bacterium]|nr:hypothetical protein [Clostridiales bacterium]